MGISSSIKAVRMAGGEVTPQAIADFSKQVWDDWRRALNHGRTDEARELETEFEALCALFQEEQ